MIAVARIGAAQPSERGELEHRSASAAPPVRALHQRRAREDASPSGGGSGSSASTTIAVDQPRVQGGDAGGLTGRPSAAMNFSVGPLTERPATAG